MRLDRHLSKSRIIELESETLEGALQELLNVATKRINEILDRKGMLEALLKRENTMTTYIGNRVALPHIRIRMKRRYIFAIGRCANGLDHEGLSEYQKVRLVILLIACEDDRNYLNSLASLVGFFKDKALVDNILEAPDLKVFRERVLAGFSGVVAKPRLEQEKQNQLMLREAVRLARRADCTFIMFFVDTFVGEFRFQKSVSNFPTLIVTRTGHEQYEEYAFVEDVMEVRSFSNHRLAQMRSAILIGLSRGVLDFQERLCCVGGLPGSNQLDTIILVDISQEFHSMLNRKSDIIPSNVKVEVLERIFGIATEIAIEGREGTPVGCLFVVGDTDRVMEMVKPLVLNPFYGYKAEDRNVLNPFMDETIKEFSTIDGAFIIRGDGTIESAGSLLNPPLDLEHKLPSGLGARHAAAAAISLATNCVAITVSESTGQVSIFRRGIMLPLFERNLGGV